MVVFSRGYVCPIGVAIADVHHDPDRLRAPVQRIADGTFVPIGWNEAFDLVGTRLSTLRAQPTVPTPSPCIWAIRSSTTTCAFVARQFRLRDRDAQQLQRWFAGH
jgi:anaerobic selenocysteine-containing dehydrogenase